MDKLDPIFHLLPDDQLTRVFNQDMCDIDPTFLGFTEIYKHLSEVIPHHWTVVDLGCAYAPQAFLFKDHKAYIGVDRSGGERFTAPNSTHIITTIREFIGSHLNEPDLSTTFAICSYVPPWHDDNRKLVRENFENCFIYYPAKTPRFEGLTISEALA